MIKNNYFDDFLDLLNYDFGKYKYIVFIGNSGSGKSTYINKLLEDNKSLAKNIEVIDEIFDIYDFIKLLKKFTLNKQFIIASHISINYIYIFRLFGKIKKIETDKNIIKIYNYLDSKKLVYSKEVVGKYVSMFSSTYTDVDIILENYNGDDFDKAFYNFIKFNRITLTGNKNNK